MNTTTRIGLVILVVAVLGAGFFFARNGSKGPAAVGQLVGEASYSCNEGKTIVASYYQGESKPAAGPDQPPVPGGSVELRLSDGRSMTLAQTISADGTRYASADESFVFWSRGNGALVLENNEQKSYIGCIEVAKDPGNLPQAYQNGSEGFSLRYPAGFTVDESYRYQALGPGKDISGIKFMIPASMATGTNLSPDSYLSVEQVPQSQSCTADLFLAAGVAARSVDEGGTTYSVASSSDAAAGNRYEETVYAMPGTNPCVAVRYFIHYGAIGNYPEGAVQEFDRQALLDQFDAMRRTLTLVR